LTVNDRILGLEVRGAYLADSTGRDGKDGLTRTTPGSPSGTKDGGEDLVNDFWKLNTHLDRSVDILVEEEHRCVWCNAGNDRAQDFKTHHTKGCHSKPQSLANGTRTAMLEPE